MKRRVVQWKALSLAFVLAGTVAASQGRAQQSQTQSSSSQSSQSAPPPGTIGDRKENQQDRIAQGVKSGQLTAGETANLETKEAALNKEVRTDRKDDGGTLTQQQRNQINRQQNHLSNQIYQDKHNASTQHNGNSEVGQRQENQQDRIAQGIKSGQLTAGETSKLESKEAGLNKEVRTDRQANGGKLTQGEKQQVNRQQNRLSNKIYQDKHNGRTQHPRK
ncbi:MAG TPA: hypothetical protein VGZ48_03585 [Candidatus Acidoferrales bacterium]|jgi:hypothetical protein|nr:hypothetical protein [Candidatus Acidoferrales bacterium]